jgi:Na+/proline symporter
VLILFILGVISIPHFQGQESFATDAVLPEMLRVWGLQSGFTFAFTVLVLLGLLAAIMSTADSVLLSLSSIIAKDILGKSIIKNAPEEKITQIGKRFSWLIMFLMVLFALQPKITLWGLIELKMQILVQTAPLFLLGIYAQKITGNGMMWGLSIGFLFAVATFVCGINTLWDIHVGLYGLVLNILAAYFFSKKQTNKKTFSFKITQ